MLLCLIKIEAASEHRRHTFHQRLRHHAFALPAQLAKACFLHYHRQGERLLFWFFHPFAKLPVVARLQFQVAHSRVFLNDLDDMAETMRIYLAGIQRL
ncbi:hypothetical protein D3C76_1496690 [compost metagenome]